MNTAFDPAMALHEQLSLALTRSGYPPLAGATAYRQIGAGAWHDAYLVYPRGEVPLVVRLRKQIVYGREAARDAASLHADYAPVGLYYQTANRRWPGKCPAVYHYRTDADLVYTLESYVPGQPLPLPDLSLHAAHAIGVSIGEFFRVMHLQDAPLPGSGLLTWDGHGVCASLPHTREAMWQERTTEKCQQAEALDQAALGLAPSSLQCRAAEALAGLAEQAEPLTLVNRDITPENLLADGGRWVGLIDPIPLQDSGIYYAALFLYGYRLHLPAMSQAPRYARHGFQAHAAILAAIADGYAASYAQGNTGVRRLLQMAEWLWTLELAYESYVLLRDGLNDEMRVRRGDEANVRATLARGLHALETLRW